MNHSIQNQFLTVTASEQGAQLQSILGCDGTEYLWQGDPTYWSDRALNIFPYVARLTDGCYQMDGQRYRMQIHGIAPYRRFQLVRHEPEQMVLELTDDQETYFQYPRHFAFRVIYTLRQNTLEVTYEVENRDEKTMYFGLGGHPGFNVPLEKGKKFEDYRLRFSQKCQPKRVGFTEACFLSGSNSDFPLENDQLIPLRHDLFDEDAIVLKDMAREVTLESDAGKSITVSFPQMPYLGIWHWPKTDAPYVCIEPWCSLPSSQGKVAEFEKQPDLLSLEAGDLYRNIWTISINA